MAEPDDVLEAPEQVELPGGEGGRLGHRRRDRAVDAQHDPGVLQAEEQVVQGRGGASGAQHRGDHAEEDDGVRLDQCAVEHPRFAGSHPADRTRVHAARQQPDAGIGGGLAGADDDVLAGRLLKVHEVVDRDHAGAVSHSELRRQLSRDVGGEVPRVDHPAVLRDGEHPTRHPRDDGAVALVPRAGEELDPSRAHQPVGQHLRVVGEDRGLTGPFVQPGLRPAVLHPPTAEKRRRDAVEARGLVQPHERVRLEPVAADAVPAVDQSHADVGGVVDQRVSERHPHGAGPDHEVVGVDAAGHEVTVLDAASSGNCCRAACRDTGRPGPWPARSARSRSRRSDTARSRPRAG